mgnify:CR=1 FL=1
MNGLMVQSFIINHLWKTSVRFYIFEFAWRVSFLPWKLLKLPLAMQQSFPNEYVQLINCLSPDEQALLKASLEIAEQQRIECN